MASFNGIGAGGQFDASVMTETQYKTFSEFMQRTVSVVGGNPELNKRLTADPGHNDVFVEWAGSVAQDSSISTLSVVELWILMKEAGSREIRDFAATVFDAYNYIVQHPRPYKTPIIFDIQSDCKLDYRLQQLIYLRDAPGAEFNLLSPDAVIIPDDSNPFPPKTVASNTRVQWGREYSHDYERKTLRFNVVNDGSPVNFSISKGSNGPSVGKGRAEAIIEQVSPLLHNKWNTMWFFQKPVSSVAMTTKMELTRTRHSWDNVLKGYLEEIGAIDWL
ncbi:hypothetical protein J3R82DRAFT_7496 [Butyriboletus roseoflavus]|nr:hypothetical protein J3R82DRAFT_7496 [Butyriboletus roseoflavus]